MLFILKYAAEQLYKGNVNVSVYFVHFSYNRQI